MDATPGNGIKVDRPVEATVSWARVGAIMAAGVSGDLLSAWRAGYRRYCDAANDHRVPGDDRAGIDGYRMGTDAMRRALEEIIRRGLEALAPSQGALFR